MQLGKQQGQALNEILSFVKSKKLVYTLSGFAGSGKSFLTNIIIQELEKLNFECVICAPTHKAKLVIENFTGKEGFTIHKLLSLSPNINLMELDFNDLKFNIPKISNMFPNDSIIICDEASMVNDVLFDLMLDRCEKNHCKVLFVGDVSQIKPVNSETTSKVFTVDDKIFLTEVFRQDNESALVPLLLKSRTEFITNFETCESEKGSVYTFKTSKEFFQKALNNIKLAIDNEDILETKILSYTNERVKIFNEKTHLNLFGKDEYYLNEFLTCYDTLQFGWDQFWNGMDYIIKKITPCQVIIPTIGEYEGYNLKLYDSSNKLDLYVNIISRNLTKKQFDHIAKSIENIRQKAVQAKIKKSRQSGELWKQYFRAMESFTTPVDLYHNERLIRKATFDYGYATTLHRAQGSTINNVYLDMKSIDFCRDGQEKRQLQYVALSRTKNDVNIFI